MKITNLKKKTLLNMNHCIHNNTFEEVYYTPVSINTNYSRGFTDSSIWISKFQKINK